MSWKTIKMNNGDRRSSIIYICIEVAIDSQDDLEILCNWLGWMDE